MIPPTATPAPRFLFFADAGRSVGGGHVMRCLTLATVLAGMGGACAFAATPDAAAVLETFADPKIVRLAIPPEDAASGAAAVARDWKPDWIVLDHYAVDVEAERRLKAAAPRLMVVDDLRRRHEADLVLDSNLGRSAADYSGCEVLAGPNHALVRLEFAQQHLMALSRRQNTTHVARVLIALGLTDIGGITARVVRALTPRLGPYAVDVVVGAGAASLSDLRAMAAVDRHLHIHIDTPDMADLMLNADLAVGAGGSSVWERCALALPALTLVLADNQRPNAEALALACATEVVDATSGDFEARLTAAFRRLLEDRALRDSLGATSATICDGYGALRVAERLLALTHCAPAGRAV